MHEPTLNVPCPRCGSITPAGVPRNATLLAIADEPRSAADLGIERASFVESRCHDGHEVYVYYARYFVPSRK